LNLGKIKNLFGVLDENGELLTPAKYVEIEVRNNKLDNSDNTVAYGTDLQGRDFDIDIYGNERETYWKGISLEEMSKRIRRGENRYTRPLF
jgi:hypothetical protein